ncbi:PQQ-binding-like beta-propeller repeat protein [Polycladidibacter stylochi]|uniref:outer membrane protein assembly factor BamB family protein n=1 Tax=Polycladidibacter stylochi TaxID=1807766 RepID=UPI000ACB9732|nr:PQQ-binding-like beta-propeller repeat protein [Pseudovibrio stylochi]
MTRITGKKLSRYLTLIAVTAALAGCAGLNPFGGKEEYLEGERISLHDAPIAKGQSRSASIGQATTPGAWVQAAGPLTNNPGNISLSISGAWAWKKDLSRSGGLGISSKPLRSAARPVSDGKNIYVYEQSGQLTALTTAGGRVFTKDLRPEGEDGVSAGGGVVISGSKIFVATAYRQLFALDKSGKIVWAVDVDVPPRSAPAAANGVVIIVTQDNEVQGYDQKDGSQLWSYSGLAESAGLLSSANAAIKGNTAVIPFSSGEVMAIDIKKGEPKWIASVARSFRTRALSGLSDISASPVISGNKVIATSVSGRTIAIDLKTGEKLWQVDTGAVHTPIVSGSSVFLVGLDDKLRALDLKNGDVLWTTSLPTGNKDKTSDNWAGPILAKGQLIALSGSGKFAAVDAKTGNLVASKNINEKVYVSPIVAGGRLIVLTAKGSVAALN